MLALHRESFEQPLNGVADLNPVLKSVLEHGSLERGRVSVLVCPPPKDRGLFAMEVFEADEMVTAFGGMREWAGDVRGRVVTERTYTVDPHDGTGFIYNGKQCSELMPKLSIREVAKQLRKKPLERTPLFPPGCFLSPCLSPCLCPPPLPITFPFFPHQ